MHPTIKVLKESLTYAKFPSDDLKNATRGLVNDLGDNLDECDYEQPPFIDASAARLQTAMNEYDEQEDQRKSAGVEEDDIPI